MTGVAGFGGLDIDLRSETFASACLGRSSCTNNLQGKQITVGATRDTQLYWDNTDGFGIMGGENDEIDGSEQLTISFQQGTPFALSAIALTDLFMATDGGPGGEEALVQFYFNGEEVGPIGGMRFTQADDNIYGASLFNLDEILNVDKVVFRSTGDFNDEYSVAGLSGVLQPDPDLTSELSPELVATLPLPSQVPGPSNSPPGTNPSSGEEEAGLPDGGSPGSETETGGPTTSQPPQPQQPSSPVATGPEPQPVPAPASLLLVLTGLAGLFGLRRRCRSA